MMSKLSPTFDKAEPDGWKPIQIMGPNGHWPSWWHDPTGPEPLIDGSQSQLQSPGVGVPTNQKGQ
jgi:hypothetical protein